MNLAMTPNQFMANRIFLMDKKPNSLIDGLFTKINYCDEQMTMNGIYILSYCASVPATKQKMESTQYRILTELENEILRTYPNSDPKNITNKLSEALNSKYDIVGTKLTGKPENVLIKISGIWENKAGQIGLSYRIV
jgi:hypothetical protein